MSARQALAASALAGSLLMGASALGHAGEQATRPAAVVHVHHARHHQASHHHGMTPQAAAAKLRAPHAHVRLHGGYLLRRVVYRHHLLPWWLRRHGGRGR